MIQFYSKYNDYNMILVSWYTRAFCQLQANILLIVCSRFDCNYSWAKFPLSFVTLADHFWLLWNLKLRYLKITAGTKDLSWVFNQGWVCWHLVEENKGWQPFKDGSGNNGVEKATSCRAFHITKPLTGSLKTVPNWQLNKTQSIAVDSHSTWPYLF